MVVAFYLDSTEISRARRHTLFLFPRVVQINNRTLKTGFPIVLKANSVTEKANTVTPTRCQSSGQIFGCFYEVYLSRGGSCFNCWAAASEVASDTRWHVYCKPLTKTQRKVFRFRVAFWKGAQKWRILTSEPLLSYIWTAHSHSYYLSVDTLDTIQRREEQIWGIRQNKQASFTLLQGDIYFKCLTCSSVYSNRTCSLCGSKETASFL